MTDDELLDLETAAIQSIDGELRGPALKAVARIRELLAQLPSGMEHCMIEFKECEHGHGRLVATNWVDHGCHFCRIRELEAVLKLIMAGGSHSEGMQWREHDLSQVRTIAAAALAGDFRASQPGASD